MKRFQHFSYTIFLLLSFSITKAQFQYGQQAPDITLPAADGTMISLSSLKGKIVLLDFWASWCGPCRTSNKGLTKLYPKFKEKGFEIFAVSLDDNKNSWKKAMKQDKISWLQVNDPGGWRSPTAQQWGINAIPTSYLIDQEGKIIAMDLEGKYLEKALKNMLK